jgi:hypothetical protein
LIEHRIPLWLGQLVGEPVGADAGVVEEDVDAPETLDGGADGFGHGGGVAHVGDGGQARRAGGLALGAQRLELLRGAHLVAGVGERRSHVEGDDVVAVGGQGEARGAALPVGGAGDEGDGAVAHVAAARR